MPRLNLFFFRPSHVLLLFSTNAGLKTAAGTHVYRLQALVPWTSRWLEAEKGLSEGVRSEDSLSDGVPRSQVQVKTCSTFLLWGFSCTCSGFLCFFVWCFCFPTFRTCFARFALFVSSVVSDVRLVHRFLGVSDLSVIFGLFVLFDFSAFFALFYTFCVFWLIDLSLSSELFEWSGNFTLFQLSRFAALFDS